jgi:hypothetical protein
MRTWAGSGKVGLVLWTLLLACEPGSALCSYSGLCEDVEPGLPEEVFYAGAVTEGPSGPDVPLMEKGALTFEDPETGQELAVGEQPDPSNPGLWRAVLEPGVEYQVRIESENAFPAIWRGRAPQQNGFWFTGALFSWPFEVWGEFVDQLHGLEEDPANIQEAELVHLFGVPVDEALVTLPLGPDRVVVTDGAGTQANVVFVEVSEPVEGEDTPIYFMAFNLAPGDITVQVTGESGELAETTYSARAGEIVTAWWFEVP